MLVASESTDFTHSNRDASFRQGVIDRAPGQEPLRLAGKSGGILRMAAQVTSWLAKFPSIRHVYALVLASADFRRSKAYSGAFALRTDLAPLATD